MHGTCRHPAAPRWLLSALGTVIAYAAIAGYDHIALAHIGRKVSLLFVSLCSFTTYALSHNIGGSVLSGAVIRYRAYATKGLSGPEIGVLVAICWFTFVIAMLLVGSVLFTFSPGPGDALRRTCCRSGCRRRPA